MITIPIWAFALLIIMSASSIGIITGILLNYAISRREKE